MKICFHVSEIGRWKTCLSNLKNTLAYGEEQGLDMNLFVVANAEAVESLKDSVENRDFLVELEGSMEKGVDVRACENALKKHEIQKNELAKGIGTVAAGVVALAEKQVEGYAYIRP